MPLRRAVFAKLPTGYDAVVIGSALVMSSDVDWTAATAWAVVRAVTAAADISPGEVAPGPTIAQVVS